MARHTVQATKNYDLFHENTRENRRLKPAEHKRLKASMKRYGFLPCFPIVCFRNAHGQLVVKEGQHRLLFAKELGLTVWWVEEETDFDVAYINCTSKGWSMLDYAQKHILNGKQVYQEGLDFARQNGLPLSTAFALLAGTTSFCNCQDAFLDGTFEIKDRQWAEAVVGLYVPLCQIASAAKSVHFLGALMAVCRVSDFDARRLIRQAERCREKLIPFATKDACLAALEDIYNYGRQKAIPLKFVAQAAMKDRSAAPKKKKDKEAS